MIKARTLVGALAAATVMGSAIAPTAARADDAPAFTYSFTFGGTSDYVFRGMSNNHEEPAAQGSVDFGYGIWYGGVWSSTNVEYAGIGKGWEVDVYTGLKPVVGPVTFDFGILGYLFPTSNQDIGGREANYLELKAGASMSPVTNLTLSVTDYLSPDGQFEVGLVNTIEGAAAYTLPQVAMFTPTISGTVGYVKGFDDDFVTVASAFGEDNYVYWNAGLALAVEKFTFDFRYWDTNLDDTGCNDALEFNCDARFVFSAKVVLP